MTHEDRFDSAGQENTHDPRKPIKVSREQLRQEHAIMASTQKRRNDLRPLREAVDDEITRIGWKVARPIVAQYLQIPMIALRNQRGGWWSKVGKRNGPKLLEALKSYELHPKAQSTLWDSL